MSAPNKGYDPVQVTALHPDEVARAQAEALQAIAATADLADLKEVRLAHDGDRSPLALANREIGALPPHAKAEAGKRVVEARGAIRAAFAAREADLTAQRDARVLVEEAVDVSLPYDRSPAGARHPLTTISERICDIFVALGYAVADGPEVEAEWFNFDALNMPADHPAREMQDTLFVAPEGSGLVLRTHTSPVQVRSLLTRELPVYVICPGRTYRADELDATHSPVFNQVEGLVVDENVGFADLKGHLQAFLENLLGTQTKTRFRPSYFPFTEPSTEVDVKCFFCQAPAAPRASTPAGSRSWARAS